MIFFSILSFSICCKKQFFFFIFYRFLFSFFFFYFDKRKEEKKKKPKINRSRISGEETHAGDVVIVADAFLEETVADFPGENRRALAFELRYFVDDFIGSYSRLGTPNGSWSYRTRLVVPIQYSNIFNHEFEI